MTTQIHYKAGPSDTLENADVPKRDLGEGVIVQVIAQGEKMNAVHWNLPDGAIVPRHNHPQEQFGYVIRGALEITVEGVGVYMAKEGDSYLIPSNLFHVFKAVGVTEAIDVFSPLRDLATIGGRNASK